MGILVTSPNLSKLLVMIVASILHVLSAGGKSISFLRSLGCLQEFLALLLKAAFEGVEGSSAQKVLSNSDKIRVQINTSSFFKRCLSDRQLVPYVVLT